MSAKYQGYSLTSWPKIAHFHHFSICNQNQSISILVICRQNTKVIALLFGQKSLIFITFQSAINFKFVGKSIVNFNFGHLSANYHGYSLTFWPKIAHFHHFSICNQTQSISILVICRQNTKVIALRFGQKSLIFITFQLVICRQTAIKKNQSISILVICRQTTKVIALRFGQKSLIFITFQSAIKINQFQFWSFVGKIPTFWPKIAHFLNVGKIINFVGHLQNTKVIALLVGQKSLISITFQSAIKINQFQCWSFVGKIPRL